MSAPLKWSILGSLVVLGLALGLLRVDIEAALDRQSRLECIVRGGVVLPYEVTSADPSVGIFDMERCSLVKRHWRLSHTDFETCCFPVDGKQKKE
jgi:hypothetical protein